MNQIDRETISALLDNEADDLELRRFLKSTEQDPSLLETWERFSLVQSALHESAQAVSSNLSERIAAQIELEAPLSAVPNRAALALWKDSLSKMAIAASVAAVFLVAVQLMDSGPDSTAIPALADQSSESSAVPVSQPLAMPTLDSNGNETETITETIVVDGGVVRQYIDSLTLDDKEPVRIEHMQDSPLYRLVNELQAKP